MQTMAHAGEGRRNESRFTMQMHDNDLSKLDVHARRVAPEKSLETQAAVM